MFGSAILETAIGLILVYLLLSLICSSAREGLEAMLKSRASMLEKGIGELLRTSTAGAAPAKTSGLVAALYNHPLIYSLYRGEYVPGGKNLPSYIPARSFALALMDIVVRGPIGPNDVPRTLETLTSTLPGRALTDVERRASTSFANVPTATTGSASATAQPSAAAARATGAYLPPAASGVAARALSLAGVAESLASSTDLTVHAKRALVIALETSNNDFGQAQKNIEAWYNTAMDRVSGWYKHQSQKYLFLLGLGVTVIANVDTVAVGKALYLQPSVRQALVAEASVVRNDSSFRTGQVPATSVVGALEQFDLPLGWSKAHYHPDWFKSPTSVATVVIEPALGWLLTSLAIALGAPFWFDMLNRIMVVRSTVKPIEKTLEGTSNPPLDDSK